MATTSSTGSGDPERGRRLGALLYLFRGDGKYHPEHWGALPLDQQAAVGEPTAEDMHLLNACLEVERWALRRECRMAGHLLAYDMFGHRELCEATERDDLAPSHWAAMHALGLLDLEPDPDDEQ